MTTRRLFPAALTTVACALALAPASAHAFAWTDAEVLSDDGAQISQLADPSTNNAVAAGPDGAVTVAWIQNDGSNDRLVARRFSPTTGAWTDPQYVSPAGESLARLGVAMDSDGNATAFWLPADGNAIKASTVLAGQTDWSSATTLAVGPVNAFGIAEAGGTVTVAVVVPDGGDYPVEVHTRARNSAAWNAPTTVASDSAAVSGPIAIDYNAAGDGVMLFSGNASGVNNTYISRFEDGAWSDTPTTVFPNVTSGFTGMQDAVIAANGDIGAVIDTGAFQPTARIAKADGTLTAVEVLGNEFSVIPQIAADDRNRFVITWETLDMDTLEANARYSVGDSESGAWSTPAFVPGAELGGPLGALSNNDGTIKLLVGVGLGIASIDNYQLAGTSWSSDTASWSPLVPVEGESGTTYNTFLSSGYGHSPASAISSTGDLFAVWSQNLPGSTFGIGFAAGDATGPVISGVNVPASGEAGTPLAFSASASDVWSDVDSLSWDFGDGATKTGSPATHTYVDAGTYTVTVTAADTAGNQSTATRQVTVAAPAPPEADEPEDEPVVKKPAVLAPVIEAKLSGRTITLTTKVTVRAGKSCSGKATATTRFGTTTYRTSLKLSKVGKDCLGKGTIKLKKTPSTRTKLKVTVSAKTIKTRTLTTKRG